MLPSFDGRKLICTYGDSNFLIVHYLTGESDIAYFIRVRDGKISSSCFHDMNDIDQSFYLASESLLLLVNRKGIRKLKIHNIESFLDDEA